MGPAPTRTAATAPAGGIKALVIAGLAVVASFPLSVTLVPRAMEGVSGAFTHLALAWSELFLVPLVALWLVALARRGRRPNLGPWFVALPVAVLLAASWASVPLSIDPALAALSAVKLSVAIAVGVMIASEITSERIAVPLLLVVAIHSLIAIAQSATQHSLGLTVLGEPHLAVGLPTASQLVSANGELLLRAYGLAGNPNLLGGVLAIALLLMRPDGNGDHAGRAARAVAWAIGAAALFLSFSRSGAVGLALGTVVAIVMLVGAGWRTVARRWGLGIAAAGMACIPLVLAFAPFLATRSTIIAPTPAEEHSINERLGLAGQALEVLSDRPIVGSGIGTLSLAFREAFPESPYRYHPAHIVGLTVAAETGVIGGLGFAVLLVSPWIALARRRLRWSVELIGASAALAAISVIGLFDYYPWGSSVGRLATAVSLGLWVAAWRRSDSPDPLAPP